MSQPELLACYESLHASAQRMLAAATVEDWSALQAEERNCDRLFARAAHMGDPMEILDPEGRRKRMVLLSGMLATDARIRNLTEPWLLDLERYVGRA